MKVGDKVPFIPKGTSFYDKDGNFIRKTVCDITTTLSIGKIKDGMFSYGKCIIWFKIEDFQEWTIQDWLDGKVAISREGSTNEEVADFLCKYSGDDDWSGRSSYYYKPEYNKYIIASSISPKIPIVHFSKLKENKVKKYIAPYDMFNGEIKKGDIFEKLNSKFYKTKTTGNTQFSKHLPKEIVETWEEYKPPIKIGDYIVITRNTGGDPVGTIAKIIDIDSDGDFVYKSYSRNCTFFANERNARLATPEEIRKAKAKVLTLSNGKYVTIRDKKVYAEGKEISKSDLKSLIEDTRLHRSCGNYWDVTLQDATFKIGCWENIKLSDIEIILEELE